MISLRRPRPRHRLEFAGSSRLDTLRMKISGRVIYPRHWTHDDLLVYRIDGLTPEALSEMTEEEFSAFLDTPIEQNLDFYEEQLVTYGRPGL